ncbi:MAG TPA: hypothetical protein VFP84_17115, partial [Kofleriaceae bacterium]|nr:hypothetical protein [Kofleriaceae bacterium]
KLRAPFAAARAYLAAHGGLVVRTRRVAGALEVSIGNDPLHMAVAVRALDLPAIATPLAGDAPARLAPVPARLAILDEHGNHLRELAIAPVELAAPRAWRERPLTWIVPAAVLAGVAGGAFALAVRAQHDADAITADSAHHRLADADHALGRARGFAIAGGIAAAGALGLGTVGAVVAVRF